VEVKGTAFLARRDFITREFGAERFEAILKRIGEVEPCFLDPILATTRLPMKSFLAFNELLVEELYGGDQLANFHIGEQSAEWAFGGPYKHIVTNRSVDAFLDMSPVMYRNYYDQGEAHAERVDHEIRLTLRAIPAPYRSLYIEYGIMGYFRRGLEMITGATPEMIARKGFSKHDEEVVYLFRLPPGTLG